jgi:hypothetical protein
VAAGIRPLCRSVHRPSIVGVSRLTMLGALIVALLVVPTTAQALCGADPNPVTFAQLIRDGSTHAGRYDRLFLGRILRVSEKTAVMNVRAHVGPAPDHARIAQRRVLLPDRLLLEEDRRYGLVVQRRDDGRWRYADCGPSRQISAAKLRRLVRLAR